MSTKMANRASQSGLKFAANLSFLFDQLCLPVRTVLQLHTVDCVRRISKYKEWERQHNVKEVGMFYGNKNTPILGSEW